MDQAWGESVLASCDKPFALLADLACSCFSGQRTLATQAATLALAHAAPDTELLAVVERVFQAVLANNAAPTDFLGFFGGRTTLREEQIWFDAKTVGEVPPCLGFGRTVVLGGDGDVRQSDLQIVAGWATCVAVAIPMTVDMTSR